MTGRSVTEPHDAQPVTLRGALDPRLNRWLWLVKWVLVLPHVFLLVFLWMAFVVVSVIAFVAILVTGRYPRSLFDFNVGVLRWSWRVAFYSYAALGTDRYPPFTLADDPDYPAHLDIAYPEQLSRGLVLVKWWLLAIPQYLVVGILAGGAAAAWSADGTDGAWGSGGLIGLLVLIAAVVLAFTGAYPRSIFDLVLGLNRWVVRVVAYAALMTDAYPPFRLDMGGDEFGGAVPPLSSSTGPAVLAAPASGPPAAPVPMPVPRSGWTAGRVVALCLGSLLGLVSLGLFAGGGALAWLDHTQRDAHGFLTSPTRTFATSTYAISSDRIDLGSTTENAPASILGTVRIRVTAGDPSQPVFVGIGRHDVVDRYLAGVRHVTIETFTGDTTTYRFHPGTAPAAPPTTQSVWVRSSSGPGTRTITWKPSGGDWTIVAMRPDGSRGLAITADLGATVPALGWIDAGLFIGASVFLIAAVLLITLPIVLASRRPETPGV
jgi:hypothetical protein